MVRAANDKSGFFDRVANHNNPDSFAARLRSRRLSGLKSLLAKVPRPMTILDVGGNQWAWEKIAFTGLPDVQITLLNIEHSKVTASNIRSVVGDARNMPEFRDGQFDLVFSNSVIEHVGGKADVKRMADEVRRVGKRYYVQTPNRYFPVEPHFLFPFFQFLPVGTRTMLLQNFKLGYIGRIPQREAAEARVRSIDLLSKAELEQLFPDAVITGEKVLGLTKSWVTYKI